MEVELRAVFGGLLTGMDTGCRAPGQSLLVALEQLLVSAVLGNGYVHTAES